MEKKNIVIGLVLLNIVIMTIMAVAIILTFVNGFEKDKAVMTEGYKELATQIDHELVGEFHEINEKYEQQDYM